MKRFLLLVAFSIICFILLFSFGDKQSAKTKFLVLGTAQDAGYPQIACEKECCKYLVKNPEKASFPTSLALLDYDKKQWWLVEATPHISEQLQLFRKLSKGEFPYLPEGIILSHAHIGHYAGLMFLGKEALGAGNMKVYCLPRMSEFLKNNGPWEQLVSQRNIVLNTLNEFQNTPLSEHISFELFGVPHRDEYSETAGMRFRIDDKQILFIPDIDKWERWKTPIDSLVGASDIAFLDATFYSDGELGNRDMSQIPHPFVKETMQLFDSSNRETKAKIHFIHLNHSNPLFWNDSLQIAFEKSGFNLAKQGRFYP